MTFLQMLCFSIRGLGHKANHHKPNNATYDVFDHPRFGFIKAPGEAGPS
jgi:hypothetical protein